MADAPISVTMTQLVLAAIPPTLAAIAALIQSIRNHSATKDAGDKAIEAKEAAAQTTAKVEEIRITVNGKLELLIDTLREKAAVEAAAQRAIGQLEGIAKGREIERAAAASQQPASDIACNTKECPISELSEVAPSSQIT